MTNRDKKDSIRGRMADAGEPFSVARRKAELLHKCFPSQTHRDWWDDEVFLGLARLRGMECRAPYAEAFRCAKSVFTPGQIRFG